MRFVHPLLISFICLHCLHAQDNEPKYSLFGCSQGAVETNLNNKSPLQFVPLDHLHGDIFGGNEHRFVFHGAQPFDTVNVYFSATLGEAGVGRGSSAGLGIYAEMTNSGDGSRSHTNQWWRLEPAGPIAVNDASSETLKFDAEGIRGCFELDGQCRFADVALATPDPDVALLAVKFGENLGGANANNWTEASLLLDFRQSPPRVLATADCGYNEGGGVCTAQDSGEAARSDLRCAWKGEKLDFLCSEESSTPGDGHSDFYLLSDDPAPLRTDEVASLQDAARELRSKGKGASVKVRGIGPVGWIDEIEIKSGEKMVVLGSAEFFYFVRESPSGLAIPIQLKAHPVIEDQQRASGAQAKPDSGRWTLDRGPTFRSRRIAERPALTVLQVLAHEDPSSRQLYWIGVDSTGQGDAVQLVGGDSYAGCGRWLEPANVVSVGEIARPFTVKVRLQPATMTAEDGESLMWEPNEKGENVSECIRSGQISWQDGKFRGTMNGGICASPGQPKHIRVDDMGGIVLTDTLTK